MKQDEKEFITHTINGTKIIPFGGNCPVQIVFRSALPSKVIWLDRADTGLQMTREICPLQNVPR